MASIAESSRGKTNMSAHTKAGLPTEPSVGEEPDKDYIFRNNGNVTADQSFTEQLSFQIDKKPIRSKRSVDNKFPSIVDKI